MRPEELAQRVKALRLTRKDFAALAGVDPTHMGQILGGRLDCRRTTLEKVEAALLGAELEEAKRLASLHPREALAAATVAMCPQGKAA